MTDNENLRNQSTITRANKSQEQRNERRRANSLRQRLVRQRVTDTFRTREIQGQVYHQIGSLMPMPDNGSTFSTIYFIGDEEQQINARCQYNHIEQMEEREIVGILEPFVHNHNQLVQLFNTVGKRLYKTTTIRSSSKQTKYHLDSTRPDINEVAVVIVDDAFERLDIRIKRRDNTVHTIEDNHRSYDALQYP